MLYHNRHQFVLKFWQESSRLCMFNLHLNQFFMNDLLLSIITLFLIISLLLLLLFITAIPWLNAHAKLSDLILRPNHFLILNVLLHLRSKLNLELLK